MVERQARPGRRNSHRIATANHKATWGCTEGGKLVNVVGEFRLGGAISLADAPPKLTPHQAKLFAHILTRQGLEGGTVAQSLAAARVDLNPHQVDAALFAMRSPLSRGVALADEVGLGKTIEAALVIAQRWWERRRHILLIVPASLRKQWATELAEKFSLPTRILDDKRVKDFAKAGIERPWATTEAIVVMSYEYAARLAIRLREVPWQLVIFDKAHKLRNVYKAAPTARAAVLKETFRDRPKLC